jgi:CCR4-NOT transcription complex subunit 1
MNLDPLSFSLSQISFLVANLNKRNFKSSQSELNAILSESAASSSSAAYEAERHLFRYLLSSIDLSSTAAATAAAASGSSTSAPSPGVTASSSNTNANANADNKSSTPPAASSSTTAAASSGKDHHQIQLLRDLVCAYLARPNFPTLLSYCVDNPLPNQQEPVKYPANLAAQISKLLKLNQLQEIGLAICLKESNKDEIRKSSNDLLKQKLPELIDSFPDLSNILSFNTINF